MHGCFRDVGDEKYFFGSTTMSIRNTAIVLVNFRRPHLTSQALVHLRSLEPDLPIVATVDGPYSGERDQDELARQETARVVARFAEHDSLTTLISPTSGRGITRHVEFALAEAFESMSFSSVILMEEDQQLQPEGLDFLKGVARINDRPVHATAFSSTQHAEQFTLPRLTLFPEQWGVLLNAAMYERYLFLRKRGSISYREVFSHFLPILGSRIKSSIAADYWTALFNETLGSRDQFDGGLQAALCSSRTLTETPWRSGLKDLGGGEGAFNERTVPAADESHESRLQPLGSLGYVCLTCERASLKRRELDWRMPLRRRLRVRSRLGLVPQGTYQERNRIDSSWRGE